MAKTEIKRLLVANRGEIAIRIFSTARELGKHTIAIYTSSDANHAGHADEAILLDSPSDFTDASKIVEIARQAKADAVHPGYGFLSENADFADALSEAGILFVGPNTTVLRQTGDKTSARMLAESSGVPVLPGLTEGISDLNAATDFISKVGFPIMIKAVDGGGGRGIRLIEKVEDLADGFNRARGESPSGSVFIEKAAVHGYRHVEVQVLGDLYGNVTHLWERECSLQRRFQKMMEVAPSTIQDRNLVANVIECAMKMAKAIKYTCLGTFEFLVHDSRPEFYFLEVNPRLQVEHTITEEISGVDLVRSQLLLVQGTPMEELKLPSKNLSPRDVPSICAMQLRITAEDPSKGFQLSMGKISSFEPPSGPGVRVDSHLSGINSTTVGASFDSLLAKVIVRAQSYEAARIKGLRALSDTVVQGVKTNINVLLGILSSADFSSKACSTRWLEANLDNVIERGSYLESQGLVKRSSRLMSSTVNASAGTAGLGAAVVLFRKGDGFKVSLADPSPAGKNVRPQEYLVRLDRVLTNDFPNLASSDITIQSSTSKDEFKYEATVSMTTATSIASARHRMAENNNPNHISLPFPGQFVEMMVDVGDHVEFDEILCVVRQMKMELEVRSPCAGVITWACDAEEGETLDEGTLVMEIKPDEKSDTRNESGSPIAPWASSKL